MTTLFTTNDYPSIDLLVAAELIGDIEYQLLTDIDGGNLTGNYTSFRIFTTNDSEITSALTANTEVNVLIDGVNCQAVTGTIDCVDNVVSDDAVGLGYVPPIIDIERYFIDQPAFYELSSPITFAGDFEFGIEFLIDETGTENVIFGTSITSTDLFIGESSDNTFRFRLGQGDWPNITFDVEGVLVVNALNTLRVARVGSQTIGYLNASEFIISETVLDSVTIGSIAKYGTERFNLKGLVVNPYFDDLSSGITTSFTLGEQSAVSEASQEANNTITYSESTTRNLYRLSTNEAQWDNIEDTPTMALTIPVVPTSQITANGETLTSNNEQIINSLG